MYLVQTPIIPNVIISQVEIRGWSLRWDVSTDECF